MPAVIHSLLEILKVLLPLALLGGGLLYVFQGALIYFPQPLAPSRRMALAPHDVVFDHDGVRLHGWWLRGAVSAEQPLIIYYGGNAEEVSGFIAEAGRLPAGGLLCVNYRGYGDSAGRPSETTLVADALFIYDQVRASGIPPEHVVLMGRSLGSGVAVQVAAHRPVRGLILVTPFDSLLAVARHHYPFLPVRLILRQRFDSIARAPSIRIPLLVLMGSADAIIPNASTRKLVAAWGGAVRLVTIEGAGHNDISLLAGYGEAIQAFLADLAAEPPQPASGAPQPARHQPAG